VILHIYIILLLLRDIRSYTKTIGMLPAVFHVIGKNSRQSIFTFIFGLLPTCPLICIFIPHFPMGA